MVTECHNLPDELRRVISDAVILLSMCRDSVALRPLAQRQENTGKLMADLEQKIASGTQRRHQLMDLLVSQPFKPSSSQSQKQSGVSDTNVESQTAVVKRIRPPIP